MRTISIITLHRVKNYGSVLQTYATQKIFEQVGWHPEFVDFWREDLVDDTYLEYALKHSRWNKNFFTRLIYRLSRKSGVEKSKKVFNSFLEKHINITEKKYFSIEDLRQNPPKADAYCTGSDQVWNSDYNNGVLEPFFLEYAPIGKRRISFSSSFGKKQLNEKEIVHTKSLLEKYYAISVRENNGLDILSSIGLKGTHLLDPTLVLDKEKWLPIISKRQFTGKYILVYQLNIKNKNFDRYCCQLSKRTGLKIIRITFFPEQWLKLNRGIIINRPSVEDFLSLFFYADYVVTDSFHGTAFSINFNKNFSVIYPGNYTERLQSILKLTGTINRVISDYKDLSIFDEKIDYKAVNIKLNDEREKAISFLDNALNYGEK